jgi:hypothetical protein
MSLDDRSSLSLSASLSSAARVAPRVFCYSILAEADPGVMPRVLELFAKRGLVPLRWVSDLLGARNPGGGRELAIDLQVEGLTPELGDYVARCLRQIHGVERVLTSEKRPA